MTYIGNFQANMSWNILLNVSLFFVAILCLKRHFSPRLREPLPPGPKGWPIIGNLLDMPSEEQWITFARWGDKWGGIIYLNLFGQPMVVVNSLQAVTDMLEKKSSIYSDRPILQMGGEMVGFKNSVALLQYGERFRESRRMMHRLMGSRASMEKFYPAEELETHRFLRRILEHPDPSDLQEHIRTTTSAIILAISHGYPTKEKDDPLVQIIDEAMSSFAQATAPGAFLVDTFPILRYVPDWFPGTTWKQMAKRWKATVERGLNLPHDYVKQEVAAGTSRPSFTSTYLEDGNLSDEQEVNLKWTAGSLMAGGADTTVSSIHSFFLAMTLYPEVQQKARVELDSVVGTGRLPTFEDRSHLPYIDALVKEIFRWNPVGPLGLPHRLTENDVQDDYLIPKGTIVVPNVWKYLHDERTYKDPFEFSPDRYIATADRKAEPDPRLAFGFGRRICPGLNVAEASVYIACAMVLSVYDISKAVENGVVITPPAEYTDSTISHPKPFKCSVKPRSEHAVAIIKSVDFMEN